MRHETNTSPADLAQGMIDHSQSAAEMLMAYTEGSTPADRRRLFAWLQRVSGREPRARLRALGELLVEASKDV